MIADIGMPEVTVDLFQSINLTYGNIMTDPIFTDPFYIKKFMEIQRQNIVMYNLLKRIEESAILKQAVQDELDVDLTEVVKNGPT
jgi:hypothetical protein